MTKLEYFLRHHAATQPDTVAIEAPLGGMTQLAEKLSPQGESEGAFLSPQGESEGALPPRGDEMGTLTYSALWQQVEQRADALQQQGVKPRQVVCLRTTQTADFLVTYFALHLLGAVAMPLENDLPQDRFDEIARRYATFATPAEVADILYTTGTTGQPKGVMISHDAILADAENLIAAQGFAPGLTFIVCGPLCHIGSLSKVWPVIHQGATLCILPGLKDLNLFFSAMADGSRRYATFLVPASVRMLLQLAPHQLGECADRLEFIENGAAAMPHADMQALCRLLPNTRLYNTYASTETGIISTYNYNDGRCQPQCLGPTMPNAAITINADGRIVCHGRTLMTGYALDPDLTATVLRPDGTLLTADLGHIDAEGMLHLTGRTGDVINVGGFKVAPTEVESAALAHPDVADCVCVAQPSPLTGQALRLLVVLREGCTLNRRALALFLSQRLERHKVPLLYQQIEHVERTFNGKINRKYYNRR